MTFEPMLTVVAIGFNEGELIADDKTTLQITPRPMRRNRMHVHFIVKEEELVIAAMDFRTQKHIRAGWKVIPPRPRTGLYE